MREAYSHEVISHGFWPGSDQMPEPVFYMYAVPEPAGFKDVTVQPATAYYHRELGEFILPYEAVRTSPDPAAAIRAFVDSTYDPCGDAGPVGSRLTRTFSCHGLTESHVSGRFIYRLVFAEPRAHGGAVRPRRRRGVYSRPIDLRHPIVFYEGHLPAFSFNTLVKTGAWRHRHRRAARNTVRARHRSVRGSAGRSDARSLAVAGRPCASLPPRPIAACVRRSSAAISIARGSAAPPLGGRVRDSRARGDAPGNAALHVASPAVRTEAAAGRVSAARRWSGAGAGVDRHSRGRATLACERGRARVRLGQRAAGITRGRGRVLDPASRRDQRRVSRVRRGQGRTAVAPRLGVDSARASRIRCSGSVTTAGGTGAACSI